MKIRDYKEKKDREDVIRIWKECGWLKEEPSKELLEVLSEFIASSTGLVAEEQGKVECLVLTTPASIIHMDAELPLSAVTTVTTSHLMRKRGAATTVTARSLVRAAEEGASLAGLGIFDQGFYNKLGFSTFPYVHTAKFDPSSLCVPALKRAPVRLMPSHAKEIYQNIQKRKKVHGTVSIFSEPFTKFECYAEEGCYGLGFRDPKSGELTHHLWIHPKGRLSGPYQIWWMAYQDFSQLLELFSVLKSLDDQIILVELREPPHVQLQDLLDRPFRTQDLTEGGKYATHIRAEAYQQCRILHLEKVVEVISVLGEPLQFVLSVHDPIERYLNDEDTWKGCGGDWTITLGSTSSRIERGAKTGLARLRSDIGSLTQLFFGVQKASTLAMTARLEADLSLISELDQRIHFPQPDMIHDY